MLVVCIHHHHHTHEGTFLNEFLCAIHIFWKAEKKQKKKTHTHSSINLLYIPQVYKQDIHKCIFEINPIVPTISSIGMK